MKRQRLIRPLLEAEPGTVVMIQAPAGYGAATLLRHALPEAYAQSLRIVDAGTVLDPRPQWPDIEVGGWAILVVRSGTKATVDAIATLLDRRPFDLRVVITSNVPLGAVAPAGRRILLLDRGDLAFTADEAAALLGELAPGSKPSAVASVAEICEGWASALVLAGDRLRRDPHGTRSWLLAHAPNHLLGRWFDGLSATERRFLVETVPLAVLTAGACDAVRGSGDSADLLARIEGSGGLLFRELPRPTDTGPAWRRHRLLTELIRARSAAGGDDAAVHDRAARWFAGRGDFERAIHHHLEAGEHGAAATLVSRHEESVIASGQFDLTLDWYRRLAVAADATSIDHELRLGWGNLLAGDISAAADSVARLELLVERTGPAISAGPLAIADISGEVQLLRAQLAGALADTQLAVTSARFAVDCFGSRIEANSHQLAPISLARALLWEQRTPEARSVVDSIVAARLTSPVIREVALRGVQASCALSEGRVVLARAVVATGEAWLAERGYLPTDLRQFTFATAAARVSAESGDLAAASETLAHVRTISREFDHLAEYAAATVSQLRVMALQGEYGEALRTAREVRSEVAASSATSGLIAALNEAEADILIRAGDIDAAERLVRRLRAGERRTLLAARVFVGRHPSRVARVLMGLHPSSPLVAVQRRLLLAESLLESNPGLSASHLGLARSAAAELGLSMLLTDHPRLAQVPAKLPEESAVEGVHHAAGGAPLSAGELELLRLLPTRQSNAQIAEQFGVSVNTVKTRLARLYRKFGVHSRDEAIASAHDRGLLD